jgi:hypothetical protein
MRSLQKPGKLNQGNLAAASKVNTGPDDAAALRCLYLTNRPLWRLLLFSDLPLLVSLLHALDHSSSLLADIEGCPTLQVVKPRGEVADEPALGRFIEQLEHPQRIDSPLLRFPPGLHVIHNQNLRPELASQRNDCPVTITSHSVLPQRRDGFDLLRFQDFEPSRRIGGPSPNRLWSMRASHLLFDDDTSGDYPVEDAGKMWSQPISTR